MDADLRNLLRYSQAQDTMVTVDSFEPPPGSDLRLPTIMPGIHAFSVKSAAFQIGVGWNIGFMNPWNVPPLPLQVFYGSSFGGNLAFLYANFRYIAFEV